MGTMVLLPTEQILFISFYRIIVILISGEPSRSGLPVSLRAYAGIETLSVRPVYQHNAIPRRSTGENESRFSEEMIIAIIP